MGAGELRDDICTAHLPGLEFRREAGGREIVESGAATSGGLVHDAFVAEELFRVLKAPEGATRIMRESTAETADDIDAGDMNPECQNHSIGH